MPSAFGIIGWPLGHTKSPLLHNWGLREAGLKGTYEAWPTEPKRLKAFMANLRARRFAGVSVTIPHKQAVLPYLDGLTERARHVGAVNTLFWHEGKLLGDNTDVEGCLIPLLPHRERIESALVLGAGGAARAACAALRELGVAELAVANRTAEKARAVAQDFNAAPLDWEARSERPFDLVLNTTPLGMLGQHQQLSPWPAEGFAGVKLVFDLVYNPVRTRLLTEAEAAGAEILSGLQMFLYQGLAQFEIWTGKKLNPSRARQLLMADMLARAEG